MSEPAPVDERSIEAHLTALASDVDRAVDRSASVGCLLYLAGVGVGVALLGSAMTFMGAAAAFGIGGLFLFGILATSYDDWKIGRAAKEFDRRYPRHDATRPVAERVLRELQSGGKGLPKFRDAVLNESVRRVSSTPVEQQVRQAAQALRAPHAAQDATSTSPASSPAPAATSPQAAPKAPEGPKHMPLEPFEQTPGPNRDGDGA